MVKCKALKKTEYARVTYNEGDEFDVEQQDVHVLTVIGHVEPVKGQYKTKEMSADKPAAYNTKTLSLPKKQRKVA